MKPLRGFLSRLNAPLIRECRDRDLALELNAHLEMLADDHIRAGVSPEEAYRRARIALGGVESVKESCRDRWKIPLLDSLIQDLRFTSRVLRRSLGFTAVAVLTLALGIGATAAIFTLIDAVLLKSLPVRDPGALLVLGDGHGSGDAVGIQRSYNLYSYDLYKHLLDSNVFEDLSALQSPQTQVSVRPTGSSAGSPAIAKLVSGNYFAVLGVHTALGRAIAPSDDTPSAPAVAVVSHRYWKDVLNADPSIIGSSVELNRVFAKVVGVAPPEFYGETLEPDPPDFWLPLASDRQLNPAQSLIDTPDEHWLYLMGRLIPGLSCNAGSGPSDRCAAPVAARAGRLSLAITTDSRTKISQSYIELTPGGGGVRHMQQYYSQTLRLLLGISGIVLLIACANIANLLLARVAWLAVRKAPSGSPWEQAGGVWCLHGGARNFSLLSPFAGATTSPSKLLPTSASWHLHSHSPA